MNIYSKLHKIDMKKAMCFIFLISLDIDTTHVIKNKNNKKTAKHRHTCSLVLEETFYYKKYIEM